MVCLPPPFPEPTQARIGYPSMVLSFRPQPMPMPPTCRLSHDAAISSLHATITQLQIDSARRSTTIATLLRTTASTTAAIASIQSSLPMVLEQLTRLSQSTAHPFTPQTGFSLIKLTPSSSISIPTSVASHSDLKPALHRQLSLLHPSPTLPAVAMATPPATKPLEHRISYPPPQSTFAPPPPFSSPCLSQPTSNITPPPNPSLFQLPQASDNAVPSSLPATFVPLPRLQNHPRCPGSSRTLFLPELPIIKPSSTNLAIGLTHLPPKPSPVSPHLPLLVEIPLPSFPAPIPPPNHCLPPSALQKCHSLGLCSILEHHHQCQFLLLGDDPPLPPPPPDPPPVVPHHVFEQTTQIRTKTNIYNKHHQKTPTGLPPSPPTSPFPSAIPGFAQLRRIFRAPPSTVHLRRAPLSSALSRANQRVSSCLAVVFCLAAALLYAALPSLGGIYHVWLYCVASIAPSHMGFHFGTPFISYGLWQNIIQVHMCGFSLGITLISLGLLCDSIWELNLSHMGLGGCIPATICGPCNTTLEVWATFPLGFNYMDATWASTLRARLILMGWGMMSPWIASPTLMSP